MITKSVVALLLGFLGALLFGGIMIPYLKNRNARQSLNRYLEETHHKKSGTPTMGGLIFLIPTFLFLFFFFLFQKINFSYSLLILMFTTFGYAMIGFLDDYLIVVKHNNKGLSEEEKLLLELIIAVIFFYFFMKSGNEPLLWIHTLHFKWKIGWLYGIFILFVLSASSNAVNLTDGLDGLAGGLSFLSILTFGIISWNTGWLQGYEELAVFCFLLAGSILGFLVYNVNPAKIFMGDTGSLALGAFLGAISILTRHELLLVLIGIVFVIETLSCIIQRFYYKRTKRRVFPMTPIHHSFEKWGFQEVEIVRIFWMIGLLASLLSISFGVWL